MPSNRQALAPDPEQVAARERLDSLYASIADAEKQLAEFKDLFDKTEALKKVKKSLEDNIEDLKVKTAELQKVLRRVQVENSAFVSSSEDQKKILIAEIKGLQEQSKEFSAELNNLNNKIKVSTRQLSELNELYLRDKEVATQGLSNLFKDQQKVQREIDLLEGESRDLKNRIAALNQEITIAEATNKNLKAEKQDIEKEIAAAQADLGKLIVEGKEQAEKNKAMLEKALAEKAEIDESLKKASTILDEREKDLIVREKFTKKSIDKLHTYKTQMEEKYGERFPDLKF